MELEADKRERNQKHDIPTGQVVNVLHSGVKRVWIEMGFFIMLLAAVCTITEIDTVLHSSFVGMLCKATINTLGMVIIYYAMLKGMLPLHRPLTAMWMVLLALNAFGFCSSVLAYFGAPFDSFDFWVAASLSLAYLPMGVLLIVWYRGKLGRMGLWMILRILTVTLLPLAWFMFLGDRLLTLRDIIVLAVEVIYAYLLRDILVSNKD